MRVSSSIKSGASRTSIIVATALLLAGCSFKGFNAQNQAANQPAPKPTNKDVLVYKHSTLMYRSADHSTPDAFVYIAPGFDSSKPVHLVIYNHGMMNNLNEVEELWKVKDGVKLAPPNTVVMLPEWAEDPEALSDRSGRFTEPGFFRKMLGEVLGKTPELANLKVDDINKISIVSYSGGWKATGAELYDNNLDNKIIGVSFFDSLYRGNILDRWLKENIQQIALNKKHYHNYYFHTYPQSRQQLKRIQAMLEQTKVEQPRVALDFANGKEVMKADTIADNGLVFKNSLIFDDTHHGHASCAYIYFPQEMKALAIKYQRGQAGDQLAAAKPKPVI
jgi:hypothetical protein